MSDTEIKKGETWVNKLDETNTVTIDTVGAFSVTGSSAKDGNYMASRSDFLHYFKPQPKEIVVKSDKPEIDEDNIARVIANAWCDAHITGMAGVVHPKENVPKPDMVNKPPHYKDASGIECKEITCHRKMPFSLGNAIKYLYRAGSKGDLLEDLKKAEWYLRVAYLNSEAVPEEVIRRLREVAAVRKTEAGRALNLISHHKIVVACGVVKAEIEKLEAGNE